MFQRLLCTHLNQIAEKGNGLSASAIGRKTHSGTGWMI